MTAGEKVNQGSDPLPPFTGGGALMTVLPKTMVKKATHEACP